MAQFKRDQVMTGPLPDDFLRLPPSQPSSTTVTQGQTPGGQFVAQTTQGPYGVQQQVASYAAPMVGVLSLTVAQARLAKNYGITRMDPYCRIRLGHHVYETQTAQNGGKNPHWNKTIRCDCPPGCTTLYIELYDERAFSVDERIAWGVFELPDRVFDNQLVDDWFPLSGKQGDEKEGVVNLIMEFKVQPSMHSYMYTNQPMMVVPGTMPAPQVVYQGGFYPAAAQPYPQSQLHPQSHPRPQQPGQQQQQQPRQPITEQSVQQLKDMFPSMDDDVIRSVLEASGGHVDVAINNLLSFGTSEGGGQS
ncbi:toll-interacting protein B-like [Oscarella lobularis]|uniref:toll-interacting protein B-like n=1 Tax=Oscarella lobularis TaxID=121494 RepID=UPI00331432B5